VKTNYIHLCEGELALSNRNYNETDDLNVLLSASYLQGRKYRQKM
jgi:hypothetical protein